MSIDQLLAFRPSPSLSGYRTPIEGLFLTGAGTHPGGVTGLPGRSATAVVLEALGQRPRGGAVGCSGSSPRSATPPGRSGPCGRRSGDAREPAWQGGQPPPAGHREAAVNPLELATAYPGRRWSRPPAAAASPTLSPTAPGSRPRWRPPAAPIRAPPAACSARWPPSAWPTTAPTATRCRRPVPSWPATTPVGGTDRGQGMVLLPGVGRAGRQRPRRPRPHPAVAGAAGRRPRPRPRLPAPWTTWPPASAASCPPSPPAITPPSAG
jgi:hypothetical protein